MSRQCIVQPRTVFTPSVVLSRARHIPGVYKCEITRRVHAMHSSCGAEERALGLVQDREQVWRLSVYSGYSGSGQSESSEQGPENVSTKSDLQSVSGLHSRSRRLSMQQKLRALRFSLEELKGKAAKLPPFASVISLLAALKVKMKPLLDLLEELERKKEDLIETYEQYLAEETKLRWNWEKKNHKEIALLKSIPPYIFGALCFVYSIEIYMISLCSCVVIPLSF